MFNIPKNIIIYYIIIEKEERKNKREIEFIW